MPVAELHSLLPLHRFDKSHDIFPTRANPGTIPTLPPVLDSNAPTQLQSPSLRFHHHDRLIAALIQMSHPPVPPIEPGAVTDVEPLHGLRESGPRCFHQ